MEKLIITACITGAEVTRQQQPALAITPDEIARDAYECFQAGASIVHVHARNLDGSATQSLEIYRQIKEKTAEKCNIIFQPSTGGAVWHSFEERMQPLFLNPEMASLSCGSCNFGDDLFVNTNEYIEKFAKEMKDRNIKPEIEIFERGMIENAMRLVKKGLLDLPIHFDFVMNVPGAVPGTIEDLVHLRMAIPQSCTWTVAGIGRTELPLAAHAIAMGGHVRVGFEDNIYYSKGVLAKSNAELVERVVRLAKELERPVATPDETRQILGIRR
ncbi:MAG: 3-keto-5-aminohexanoate cleavage protein [Petrotogaceae bacterium]|jgi:3-keto-5-aminohexanoate cleavage enzyme|nr:3-keto-5-aminohexanoate cleavage protein [Petrotogaceae bacterium]